MEIIGVITVGIFAIGLLAGVFYVLFWIVKASVSGFAAPASESGASAEMNEGDFHSGPAGYSPNTAYPETFYGSGGRSDDFDGHDEGDFNR